MTQIIIVRHGESQGNIERLICGWYNCGLTDKGKRQAMLVGGLLKSIKIDKFISSDLLRAKETSEIISNQTGLLFDFDVRLRERNCGILDGVPVEKALTHPLWGEFISNPEGRIQGCENTQELYNRADLFLTEIVKKYEDKTLLLSTHGGLLWVIVPFVLGVKLKDYKGLIGMDNCALTVISYGNNKFALQCLNVTTHLGRLFDSRASWEF